MNADGDGRKQAKSSLAMDTIGTYDEGRIYVLAILRCRPSFSQT